MKKALFSLVFCLILVSTVYSAPFLTTNPQAGIITYHLTGSAWVPSTVTAQADGSLRLDVSASTVGANTVNISACSSNDALWGVLCSNAVPSTFTRPAVPSAPTGITLVP